MVALIQYVKRARKTLHDPVWPGDPQAPRPLLCPHCVVPLHGGASYLFKLIKPLSY